jgi:hypothetical protein
MAVLMIMLRMTALMKCETISQSVEGSVFYYLLETFRSIMLTWVVVMVVAAVVAGA